jgi:hypothetical protein
MHRTGGDEVEVSIPGGYERHGEWRRALFMRPLCGHDEVCLLDGLGEKPPAFRTTALLTRCIAFEGAGEAIDAGFARSLTIGDREALLLQLRRISFGSRISCVVDCPHCGGKMDLDLDAASLVLGPYDREGWYHQTTLDTPSGAFAVEFRLPNGGDQEHAARSICTDERQAVADVLDRCIIRLASDESAPADRLPPSAAGRLSELMASLDPQAELLLNACCPVCGGDFVLTFDTAEYLSSEVALRGDRLFREVHLLASYYHWSEAEILALPVRKRRRYLGLIGETMEARRP